MDPQEVDRADKRKPGTRSGGRLKDPRSIFLMILLTVAAIAQIVLSVVLYNGNGTDALRWVGWALIWISAICGWLPILTMKRHGGVSRGNSYVNTTVLVDRGIFALVRHPQYLAGILIGTGLPMIAQHWITVVLGLVVIPLYYLDTIREERACLLKFGESYRNYMARVPRVNLILGICKAMGRMSRRDTPAR